ncbi:hypothetical protein OSB04_013918 [Centaurea solstitialis]|uniref:Disease resistance protein n=1 Tax=Centaurea solstitialis TaxID=347529 RepID=A0AA38TE67_9ASTR|nr:hypothetical protein OSB04_013918 [Centaurea solstitialis]
MKNLRCLDNRDCSINISYMPDGMKELTCLQRLGVYYVGNKKGSQIEELGNLNLLGGRLELDGLGNVGGLEEAKSANLKQKRKLLSLALFWSWCPDISRSEQELTQQHEEVLEGLEPSSSLKELVIRKYMGEMISPSWLMKLRNLVRIRIWACGRCERIPSLGKLPNLKVIELWDMHGVKGFDDDEFPGLQELNISRCYKFVSLPNNLPNLVKLDIDEADDLVSFPSNLPELMVLILKGCEKLTSLSSNIRKLRSLHLEGCRNLTSLPNDLQKLESLYLEGCQNLTSLPGQRLVLVIQMRMKTKTETKTGMRMRSDDWCDIMGSNQKLDQTARTIDAILSALVSDVSASLASIAFQEFRRLQSLKADVIALKETYRKIQAVLSDSEVTLNKEKSVETWLKSLRSASLEVENILDDVRADAMLQRLHSKLGGGIKYKVRTFFSSNRNPLMVRTRVANKVKTIRKKLEVIDVEKSRYHLNSNAGVVVESTNMKETTSLEPAFEIYGRDEEVKMVVEKICSEHIIREDIGRVRVYAIWGMGGMGKTTLAQLVYNHERVKKHFDLQSWVYVSNEFQVKKLTKGIIESIDNIACLLSELDAMQEYLKKRLVGKRFFIVLDDVWIEERTEWDELCKALKFGAEGSTVMVTTRNEITSRMMAKFPGFQHHLGCLSEDESWSLFKNLAFAPGSGIREGESIRELEFIGKELVKKCKGLPLAVKTLGGLMWSKSSVSAWQNVKDNDVWQLQEIGILPALKLSYDNLLPHMKCCFVYSCLFPKGYEMGKDLLVELWMVNGFIPPRGQDDLYVIGEEIFYCLVSRSFLQDVQQEKRHYSDSDSDLVCKMHDLMHDLGRYLMRHEYCFVKPGKDLIIPNEVEVLHLSSSYPGNMVNQISNHAYLRVLRLDRLKVSTLPESICKLKHLRYLSISHSEIESLPKSIIYLQNLQVLLLRGCWRLQKLPKRMKYMRNLRCLDNRGCDTLEYMPVGIEELGCLRRLGVFVVGKVDGAHIRELGNLNLLGGRMKLEGLENVGGLKEAKSANLKHKTNLTHLTLRWSSDGESEERDYDEEIVEVLEPNSNLKELYIRGFMGKMISPSWMIKLRNLVKIEFRGCERCESIPSLGKLHSLKSA